MSIWTDIQRRSSGELMRQEDEVQLKLNEELNKKLNDPVVFVGTVDKDTFPSYHTAGTLYYVTDECSSRGKKFKRGDCIVDDGNDWQVISDDYPHYLGDYYIGQ